MSELTWWKNLIGREPMLTAAEEVTLGTMIREWRDHPDGPDNAPRRIQRLGKKAQDRMVVANLRLATNYVTTKCGHYTREAFPIEDLISEAASGLIIAAQRFDPKKGYKFSTYAYWWIRQAVTRWAETKGKLIRTPADHAQRLREAKRAANRLSHELGRRPTTEEIAGDVGMTVERLEDMVVTAFRPTSLDLAICEDGTLLDTEFATANDAVEDGDPERIAMAWRLLGRLPVEQRILIAAIHGLCGLPQMAIEEIAACARLPVAEVRRVRSAAMVTLRREEGKYVQPSRAKPLPSLQHLHDALADMLPPRLLSLPENVSSHGAETVIPGLAIVSDGGNLHLHDASQAGFERHLLPDVSPHDVADSVAEGIGGKVLHVSDVAFQLELCSQTEISAQPGGLSHAA